MGLQLGRDEYPILDQLSEEGFVDLTFQILDLVEDDSRYHFHLAASFEDEVVGFGVKLRKGIRSGFDAEMNLVKGHVYSEGVCFYTAGEQSDRLLRALAKLYGSDPEGQRMVEKEPFTAIALHQGDIDVATEPVKIKIFGRDGDPFDEDVYYESFFNVDLPSRLVFWNEKDQEYREPLLRGLSATS